MNTGSILIGISLKLVDDQIILFVYIFVSVISYFHRAFGTRRSDTYTLLTFKNMDSVLSAQLIEITAAKSKIIT